MKNLLLGFAVISLAVACKSGENNAVSDASTVEGPTAACATKEGCSGEKAASCGMEKSSCSSEAKADCSSEAKSECSGEAKVCPVTGKVEN